VGHADQSVGGLAEVSGNRALTAKRVGEHNVELFMWRKQVRNRSPLDFRGRGRAILFRARLSVRHAGVRSADHRQTRASNDGLVRALGYDTWCVDAKATDVSAQIATVNADVACGADDVAAASAYIMQQNADGAPGVTAHRRVLARRPVCAAPSGARAAAALDALVWTGRAVRRSPSAASDCRISGEQSPPSIALSCKHLHARPSGTSGSHRRRRLRRCVLALDSSMPNGHTSTCRRTSGHRSGQIACDIGHARAMGRIASYQDVAAFFSRCRIPIRTRRDAGHRAYDTRSKNRALVYHLLARVQPAGRPFRGVKDVSGRRMRKNAAA